MTQKGRKWISRLLPCWLLLGCMTGVAGQALSQGLLCKRRADVNPGSGLGRDVQTCLPDQRRGGKQPGWKPSTAL